LGRDASGERPVVVTYEAMSWISVVAGALLLGALLADVFGTVFVPRGGPGIVTGRLYRSAWALWRQASRLGRPKERYLLSLGGPLLLPATVALWALELVLAFALIYLPFNQEFEFPQAGRESGVVASLYVSAYSATTLGVGDIYPSDPLLRLLVTVEAALGFALFTVSITYLLSVYNALRRATALALEISRFVGRQAGEDAVDVVARMAESGTEEEITSWLAQTTSSLAETAQAAAQYPLVEYFHVPDEDRALPLALADLLALLTICRAVVDPREFPRLALGPTTLWAYRTATAFATSRARALSLTRESGGEKHDERLAACVDARRRLTASGVPVRDLEEACGLYVELRQEWDLGYEALRRHFGYPPTRLLDDEGPA
jgi:hypothetical protein